MQTIRIPRKLKKAFKKAFIRTNPIWRSREIHLGTLTRNYKHRTKVLTIGALSLTSWSLIPSGT